MTPLELIGTLSLGALAILAIQFGLVLYCFRGHRVGLEGVRIVRSDQWNGKAPDYWFRQGDLQPQVGRWNPAVEVGPDDLDSDRPPASVQHGQRTREVDGG